MTSVSVIITTRNEEKNIGNCLESLKHQIWQPSEVIVVDNSSTDQTKAISRRYSEKVFDKGPERSAQRNFGVDQANGEYVLYLDADMILSPTVIADCVKAVKENPALLALYIPEKIVGQGFWIKVRNFERSFYDGTVIDAVRFIRKDAFQKVQGFDGALCGPEDWDFDKKIRQLGPVGVCASALNHNEGLFDLTRYLQKKTYYSQSFDSYMRKWGKSDPDVRKQLGLWYRFVGVYVERGKFLRILAHPILTIGMYYLRFRVGMAFLRVQRLAKA